VRSRRELSARQIAELFESGRGKRSSAGLRARVARLPQYEQRGARQRQHADSEENQRDDDLDQSETMRTGVVANSPAHGDNVRRPPRKASPSRLTRHRFPLLRFARAIVTIWPCLCSP
jgi:hypothetical protein